MSENNNGATKVLYLVSCASRPAQHIHKFVPLVQAKGLLTVAKKLQQSSGILSYR